MDTGDFKGFNVALRSPGIAWFRFTTPERLNGFTASIKRDLVEAVTQAQMDNEVRVVVFTGSGRAFCAGDDLKGYQSSNIPGESLTPKIAHGHDNNLGTYNGLRTISQRVNTQVRALDKLTIAAINGVAIQPASPSPSPATSASPPKASAWAAPPSALASCQTRVANTCWCSFWASPAPWTS